MTEPAKVTRMKVDVPTWYEEDIVFRLTKCANLLYIFGFVSDDVLADIDASIKDMDLRMFCGEVDNTGSV